MTPSKILPAAALAIALCTPVGADEVTVHMLNNGPSGMMVFEPTMVKVKPGDSVKFVATAKGHNVETIKGMAPEGAPEVKSALGKDETVKFEKEGVYGFKCAPHYAMGMVALVVVGAKLDNLEQAKSAQLVPAAKKRLEPLLAEAKGP